MDCLMDFWIGGQGGQGEWYVRTWTCHAVATQQWTLLSMDMWNNGFCVGINGLMK